MPFSPGLTTKIRNISPRTVTLSFLPPHGIRLEAGQEFTLYGDLYAQLKTKRKRQAFEAARLSRTIAVVQTPEVHLFDLVRDETKVLDLSNGSLRVINPAWGPYSSSIDPGTDGV